MRSCFKMEKEYIENIKFKVDELDLLINDYIEWFTKKMQLNLFEKATIQNHFAVSTFLIRNIIENKTKSDKKEDLIYIPLEDKDKQQVVEDRLSDI